MDLDAWNTLMVADLRQHPQPGRRLYLYVDHAYLARLSGLGPLDALASFCSAFGGQAQDQPFYRGASLAEHWRKGGFRGDPPFLAHLAMSVLAVTEEPLGRGGGVYAIQNQLLGCSPEPRAPRGYEAHVPAMWQVWNAWLDGPGSFLGRRSARTSASFPWQGWARSQGLVRHRDREVLERFVQDRARSCGTGPPTVADLLEWLAYRGERGQELLDRVGDEAARDVLADVLDDEASRFQREGARAHQPPHRQGLLTYDDWAQAFGAVVAVDPDWHGLALDVGEGEPVTPDAWLPELHLTLDVPAETLLGAGAVHHLTAEVAVSVGGREVYVMREYGGGRVQCLSPSPGDRLHVLARLSRQRSVAEALSAAGSSTAARTSTVAGWCWFEGVRADLDEQLRRVLALSTAQAPAHAQPHLVAGLRVSSRRYLVGGEPDLALPESVGEATRATLDGCVLTQAGSDGVVSLRAAYPDPGEHQVACEDVVLAFTTVTHLREGAAPGRVARPVVSMGGRTWVAAAAAAADQAGALCGAHLRGLEVPEPSAMRLGLAGEVLVLTHDGDVLQVRPRRAGWLSRIGVRTGQFDVDAVLRQVAHHGLTGVVAVLTRSQRTGQVRALAVPAPSSSRAATAHSSPSTARPPAPATGRPSAPPAPSAVMPRPDLVADLVVASWCWVGDRQGHDGPARQALARALARHQRPVTPANTVATPTTTAPRPRSAGAHGSAVAQAADSRARADVVEGRVADNPYDEVLAWLSEREDAQATTDDLARTWAWLCARCHRLDLHPHWRRALDVLGSLGHVEVDWRRHQVATATATLTSLPAADGLSVLTGCRPPRLLERLDDPDDGDEAVARATSGWTLHYRTPVDDQHRPTAPTSVYVEWDSATLPDVRIALGHLGVVLQGCAAEVLLALHASVQDLARTGEQLTACPGGAIAAWRPSPTGGGTWAPQRQDSTAGLYRYRLAVGTRYAWRAASDTPLVRVDLVVGQWLARAAAGQTAMLVHHPADRVLQVPPRAWLPELLERALVLRSGLPPHRVSSGESEGSTLDTQALAYENVDSSSAGAVAAVLGQDLYGGQRGGPLRWASTRRLQR